MNHVRFAQFYSDSRVVVSHLLRLALLMCTVLTWPVSTQQVQAASAVALPQYDFDVALDHDAASIQARERVRFNNSTGRALNSVVFDVSAGQNQLLANTSPAIRGRLIERNRHGNRSAPVLAHQDQALQPQRAYEGQHTARMLSRCVPVIFGWSDSPKPG